jgi:hypothetical protein
MEPEGPRLTPTTTSGTPMGLGRYASASTTDNGLYPSYPGACKYLSPTVGNHCTRYKSQHIIDSIRVAPMSPAASASPFPKFPVLQYGAVGKDETKAFHVPFYLHRGFLS